MGRQLSLLGREAPAFDPRFATLTRHVLSDGAWVEYAPGWLSGHAALFEALERGIAWERGLQWLYDKVVDTPRLMGKIDAGSGPWPLVEEVRAALSNRYEADFNLVTLALYRTGEDSVAWHGDRHLRRVEAGFVATVSLGEPRPFLLRPRGGGAPSRRFPLGFGDLIVMGGTCQRTWEHSVPKVRSTLGPRMSLMFRHSAPLPGATSASDA